MGDDTQARFQDVSSNKIFLHLFPESEKELFDNSETLDHIETILGNLKKIRQVKPINKRVLKISEEIVSHAEETVRKMFSMLDEPSYTDSAIKALEDLLVLSERLILISKYVQLSSVEQSLITRLETLDIRRLVDAIRKGYSRRMYANRALYPTRIRYQSRFVQDDPQIRTEQINTSDMSDVERKVTDLLENFNGNNIDQLTL